MNRPGVFLGMRRKLKNLSQKTLALQLGWSVARVHRIEGYCEPTLSEAIALSEALGFTMNEWADYCLNGRKL